MHFSRHQAHLFRQPALQIIIVVVVACLCALSAWIDAGGATPVFWRQAVLIIIGSAAVGAGMWWIIRLRLLRPPRMRTDSRGAQRLAYLLTLLGWLLLVGLLWSEIRQITALGVSSPARTVLMLAGAWGMLVSVVLQAMQLPPRPVWNMHRLGVPELNLILQLALAAFLLLPTIPPTGATAWLAPVLVVGVVLLVGQMALQVLQRPGVAVMVFAAVLFYRALANFVLAQLPATAPVGAAVHFLALAPAGALDMVYAVRLAHADARQTLHFALAAGVGVVLAAALIVWPQLPGVPPLTLEAGMLVVGLGAPIGLACGWYGAAFGRALRVAPGRSARSTE